ncbi:uncharacterized protein MONBRDRAFT_24957 [Monosiga brevicollis MX1]|uniref:Uncharacterized protein n=1 Tax=Monosiga brevicollis TaxID=81824 RepID=A9UY90_MONBE|nr:uncharacterized protein MONBRDRAFT_24957 [Monosiga brevicollis MX1]EDQ89982.1 predicted protein [Monosiga brevicollis MX1]|eukprot:XP_001745404.1 hypothetical protein [Monosiga brevicollis MX1]
MDARGATTGTGATPIVPRDKSQMVYVCGECRNPNQIKAGGDINCRNCGHRILYKLRTERGRSFAGFGFVCVWCFSAYLLSCCNLLTFHVPLIAPDPSSHPL